MHIQIINFNLSGISRSEYEAAAAEAAQPISEMPGLISKRWLPNEETNTNGGVYFMGNQATYAGLDGLPDFQGYRGQSGICKRQRHRF